MDNRFLTAKEITGILQIHENTLTRWAQQGMPRLVLGPKTMRYNLDDVIYWIENEKGKGKHGDLEE